MKQELKDDVESKPGIEPDGKPEAGEPIPAPSPAPKVIDPAGVTRGERQV